MVATVTAPPGSRARPWSRDLRADRRVLTLALAAAGALTVLTLTRDVVLVSTLGVVVLTAGLVARTRTVLLLAAIAVGAAVGTVLVTGTPQPAFRIGNVVVGSLIGISAAAARQHRLRDLEALRRRDAAVLDSVAEAILGIDPGGQVRFVNTAACRLFGRHQDQLLGLSLHEAAPHLLADGRPCPGDDTCRLLRGLHSPAPAGPVDDESILTGGRTVPVEYVTRPLLDGDIPGGVAGLVVTLRDITPRREAEAARLRLIRLQAAEEEHRRVLKALEGALLPPLPQLAGLVLDVTYRPAEDGAPSGGDLYDVHVLPDGVVMVVVVDVVGKGVQSTRDALRVISLARALSVSGTPLGRLAARLDEHLSRTDPPVTATLVALSYDPGNGRLEVAGAGHPPALLVGSDGTARWLDSPGRPIGYPLAGTARTAEAVLGPGDTAVVYTDGLVEGHKDIGAGMERLARQARLLRGRPLTGWTSRLADHVLRGAERRDDTVVLALRRAQP